ncbi:MAG: ChaN family lipoprotein [Ferruginibacter sp.]|nr:ChaN family lipoprotein [Chitinophagaceae bacterium]
MKTIFIAGALLICYCCFSQGIEKHYKIYDVKNKQLTTVEQIAAACRDTHILFFGEEHNDSAGHYLEHQIFTALGKQYPGKVALSMEMFETDNQVALNDYLEGFIPEDRFSKDVRLWNNYKDYRPMIEYAKQNGNYVIAANPPRRYVSIVTRRGFKSVESLSKEAKKFLPPLPFDTLAGRYREKFMDIMKGSPGSTSSNIYYSQSLWDAGMSNSIYTYWKKNKDKKIFHCVGRFHSDEKLGTAAQLQKRKKGLKILNISCFSDSSFANPDWSAFSHLGDYIILTDPGLKKTY